MSLKYAVPDHHPIDHALGDVEAIPYHRLHWLMIGRAGEAREGDGDKQDQPYHDAPSPINASNAAMRSSNDLTFA